MKNSVLVKIFSVLLLGLFCNLYGQSMSKSSFKDVAPTPPMGWNSYDSYGSTINESQFKAEAKSMKANLLKYGWKYAVIDYLWFNPDPGGWKKADSKYEVQNIRLDKNGRPIDTLAMDKYGRLLPAVNRFPSAADGAGFKKIAAYVHSLGLKFGIHVMRGIPRQAYWDNTPIKGTSYTARDIADTASADLCKWNNNMYGVNPQKPGAQAYYNSLLDLYASWGVDFIKVDDIARPYHKGEIEMVHKAIVHCGRPIVLSLSPGEAPLSEAQNLIENANMWRISDDMWDSWKSLKHAFILLNKWSPYIQRNHWPDADMLPIGHLSVNNHPVAPARMSNFTKEETYTLLTLWSIARSPLIMGGDLLTSPEWVIKLLQNDEVIKVDQHSTDNHQVYKDADKAIWIAKDPAANARYVALFNLKDEPQMIDFKFDLVPGLKGSCKVRDLWKQEDIGSAKNHFNIVIGPHGAGLFEMIFKK